MVCVRFYFRFGHRLCRLGCNVNLPVASGNCSSDCAISLLQDGRCVGDHRNFSNGSSGNHLASNPGGDCCRHRNRSVKGTPRSFGWICRVLKAGGEFLHPLFLFNNTIFDFHHHQLLYLQLCHLNHLVKRIAHIHILQLYS